MSNRFYVIGFEEDRYTAGYAVRDRQKTWGEFEAVFYPQSERSRGKAQAIADKLNVRQDRAQTGSA